ncbi:MAG: hypothetical protein LCH43_07030 [Actinobacteria bacterium]|nr:hypothetical protein [Actinomycetota bacterium]
MSGNEWVKLWATPESRDHSRTSWDERDERTSVRVTLAEESEVSIGDYSSNVEDVSVLLVFCAFLGSDDNVFQVRETDLEKIRVVRSTYGSPLDLLMTVGGIAGAVIIGANGLAKILKTVAEAFKAHQEGIGQRQVNRREREKYDEKILASAFRESLAGLEPQERKQLRKIVKRLDGKGREARLARALANLTAKSVEVRIDDPDDRSKRR